MKKKILTYAAIVVGFLVLAYGFVPQVLGGKIVNQSDISGWQGMSREMMEWNSSHPSDQTAWTESMFGGMPTATIHASTKGDWTQAIYDALLTGKRPATYLFISLLGAFLLMLSLGVSPLIAVGGAIAVTFCAYNLQIIQVGHNTKMQALAFLPWVLSAVVFTYRKAFAGGRWLPPVVLGAAGFGLFLSFQVKANHPQITYYLAILIFVYALVWLVWLLCSKDRRKAFARFAVASGLLLVLGVAGIGTNAIKLLPTYEYTPYSMRGGSTTATEGDGAKGLKLDYATAWSYDWSELPNLMIPNYNGGSSAGAVNIKHSETYDLLKQAGQPNVKEVCKYLPLYWGPQPFTAGPMYMGAITIFLFLLGLMFCEGKEKWWIVISTVLAVLLGLGCNFMWFTKLFYRFAPMYNKFRTVSMSLTVLQFTLPMLAFVALDKLVKCEDFARRFKEKGWVALAIAGGFCLLCVLFPGIAGSFEAASDASQPDVLRSALEADRRWLLVSDALRSLLLIAASFALIWWGCSVPKGAEKTFGAGAGKAGAAGRGSAGASAVHGGAGKGSAGASSGAGKDFVSGSGSDAQEGGSEMGRARRRTAAVLVCVLVLFDLFSVGKRYLNADHFTTPRAFKSQFEKRPVDEIILADTDPSYRVLDLTVSVFNDSHPSYWHKNIGGYSPAKLQRYQEFIDATLAGEINQIYKALDGAATVQDAEAALPYLPGLASMNCRYIIVGDDVSPLRYPYARGEAWFEGDEAGRVEMISYAPNKMEYSVSSAKGGRVVFSEVYYPAGWTLTLEDGTELPIELYEGAAGGAAASSGADGAVPGGLLRCAVVPAGEHTLVMRFEPRSYALGEGISRACSILLILLVLCAAAFGIADRRRADGGSSAASAASAEGEAAAASAASAASAAYADGEGNRS